MPILKGDWIARTARVVLFLRFCEGTAAWLLYATTRKAGLPPIEPMAALSLAVWLLYLAANTALFLRYRKGRISTTNAAWDLCLNFAAILYFAAWTGGLRSPVLLLGFVKVATYGLLFGAPFGTASVAILLTALVAFLGFGSFLDQPAPAAAAAVDTEIAFLLVFAAALASAGWLFQQISRLERRDQERAEQAQRATQRAQTAANVTSALLSVSEAVSRLTNVEEVLEKIVEVAPPVMSVDSCGVMLWRDEEQEYHGAAVSGVGAGERAAFLRLRLRADEVPDLEWVQRLGHCVVLGPLASQQISGGLSPQVLVAPLRSGGRFFGVVQFTRRHWRPFNQEELRLADGIASQAALALERARLVEQSYRLLRAIQSTDEAVLITDAKARPLFANRAFHNLFGYSWQDLQAVPLPKLAQPPPGGWEAVLACLQREQRWRGELNAQARDGTRFPISLHLSPILTPEGSMEGVVAIAADIRAERELNERVARADRIAAAGQLAAGLAHEVNNALAVILGQAEVAAGSNDVGSLHGALAQIQEQGRRIARLIEELLGFARPRPPEARPVDLSALLDATLRLLEPEFQRAHVRVRRAVLAEGLTVRGDAQQLQQVLLNLLKNAVEALAGRVRPEITVRCWCQDGSVFAEVEDNGPGIPAVLAARIFDPFFTTKPKGTGLGLSVSYAIAQAHGGELSVRSVPGVGTTFTLQLPATTAEAGAANQTHVLVVDDDVVLAQTLRRMLEREGVRVTTANSGEEALALAEAADFDAIFLDVRLPDLSGPEVYRALEKKRPALARRVAFVTGTLWRGGANVSPLPPQPTLAKPCTSAELRSVLERLRVLRAAA